MDQYPSVLLERAVNEMSKLPGIGRKSALRQVLFLLRQPVESVKSFADTIAYVRENIKYCNVCHNLSDTDTCAICSDARRDRSTICVVENVQDVMALEATQQYHGLYHVLGGIISPIDGVSPGDLQIQSLVDRVAAGGIDEVIIALPSTMEGDTTGFYLRRLLQPHGVKLSLLARGIAVGGELEYADEVTLGRAVVNRTPL